MMGTNSTTIAGDWSLLFYNSEKYDTLGRLVIDTDGWIDIFSSIITMGIHFLSDTALEKRITSCTFRNTPAGEGDITAVVDIADCNFVNNSMCNGICGCIKTRSGHNNVGGDALDRYFSLQDAINATTDQQEVINICEDLSGLAKIILTGTKQLVIDSDSAYSLSFTGDIVTVGNNQSVTFAHTPLIVGEKAEVAGTNAMLIFEKCATIRAYTVATSGAGSMVIYYFSSPESILGHPVATINNTDTIMVAGYSRLRGYRDVTNGQPAILLNVDAADRLKVKYSTLTHGKGGVNSPLINTSGIKTDIRVYASAFSATYNAAHFNNMIGSANNTFDQEIDF
jgi:hypothetical protein